MSRKRLLEQVIRTGHGGSPDSHSAEGKEEVCRKNKILKREMYGQPAQKRRLFFSACQVQCYYSLADEMLYYSLADEMFFTV